MDLGLTDRVYIVTGALEGLGRACAEQLVTEGARLVLAGADEDRLIATAAALGGSERAMAIPGDLAEPGAETCLVAAAVARYGRLDGALIAVDPTGAGSVMRTTDAQWRQAFESTFLGPIRLCRAVGENVSFEGGSLVLVLSSSAKYSLDNRALDNGLHPGLALLAKDLGGELGTRNVRVNCVLPGLDGGGATPSVEADTAVAPGETPRSGESQVPLHRFGEPLEFARPAVFLLSPAASYVSGAVLGVDGGWQRGL